jgi:hypothetical protein
LATGSPAPSSSGSAACSDSVLAPQSPSGLLLGSGVVLSPVAAPTLPPERPRTRLQSSISKPKKFTDGTIRYAHFCSTGEPFSNVEKKQREGVSISQPTTVDNFLAQHTIEKNLRGGCRKQEHKPGSPTLVETSTLHQIQDVVPTH